MAKKNNLNNALDNLLHLNFKSFLIKSFQTLSPNSQFIDNWHLDLMCKYLEGCAAGKNKRMLINIPPRSLKSTIISVAWPAWILGNSPEKRIIVASYSMNLSIKLSEDTRVLMNSNWYKKLFPKTKIRAGSNKKDKFITTKGGFRMATSIDATLTGEGADVLIVDDPQTPTKSYSMRDRKKVIKWFDQTFMTRLNNKREGIVLVVMQRLHGDDLSGHILKKKIYTHLCLSSINNNAEVYKCEEFLYERNINEPLNLGFESIDEINKLKNDIGSYAFSAQYLQSPLAADSAVINMNWFGRYDTLPQGFDSIVQSLDLAVKTNENADYSVITTWGILGNIYYLIDCFRDKLEYQDIKAVTKKLINIYNPDIVLIEDKALGQPLVQEFSNKEKVCVKAINPTKNKFARLMQIVCLIEQGRVFLPNAASWSYYFEHELSNFPNAENDDCVDSMTQFLNWVVSHDNDYSIKIV